jgi:hypothetical protein
MYKFYGIKASLTYAAMSEEEKKKKSIPSLLIIVWKILETITARPHLLSL